MTKKTETFVTTIAFVGQPNVGKSTLLNALVGTKIAPTSRKPQTTRRIIRGIKTVGNYQQIYFDTPGVLKKQTGLDQFMHGQIYEALADVEQVVALVDAHEVPMKNKGFLERIADIAKNNKQPLFIVINKIDSIANKKDLLDLISKYKDVVSTESIIPISAMSGDGLNILFDALNKKAKPSEFLFNEELFTDASEKEIVGELIREKAMLELKDELPYRLAVTIESFDESRREEGKKPLITIEAVLHVERQSQKAIVIGKGGVTIRTIGSRARKDIEHLLNCQVMLTLFVRVEPNWTTNPKSLRKLGY